MEKACPLNEKELLPIIYIGFLNCNISSHIIFTYDNLSSSSLSLVDIFSG